MTDNGRVVTIDDPDVGPCRQVGPLARFKTTPSTIGTAAPPLGAGPAAWRSSRPAPSPSPSPAGGPHPLSGVTVLEVAYFLAGPLAGTLLAEMGARVIKVEPPGGDPTRRLGLQAAKLMHGKESIVLDLKTSDGMDILLALVDRADVFIHSFRPGVAERLGIDGATLTGRNPDLVYVHGTSYGSEGPQARRAAFHSTPNALVGSGILQAGDGNPPVDDSYPDPCSALGVATAALLGLHARRRNRAPQIVETTMLATTGHVMSSHLARYESAPGWTLPDPGQHGIGPLQRLYRSASGWVFVGCTTQAEWRALAGLVGRPAWCGDARFADASARSQHAPSSRPGSARSSPCGPPRTGRPRRAPPRCRSSRPRPCPRTSGCARRGS